MSDGGFEVVTIAAKDVRVGDALYNSAIDRATRNLVAREAFRWIEVEGVEPSEGTYRTEGGHEVRMPNLRIVTTYWETYKIPEEAITVRRWKGPADPEENAAWVAAGRPGMGTWILRELQREAEKPPEDVCPLCLATRDRCDCDDLDPEF